MERKVKRLFLDLETTGTDYKVNGIIQIAGIVSIDSEVVHTFDMKCSPFRADIIDPQALTKNKKTQLEIFEQPNPYVIHRGLINLFSRMVDRYDKEDKFQLIGYNAKFDDDFLRRWFEKCGADKWCYGSFISWPVIDVASLAAEYYIKERHLFKDFKLMTVAEYAGIKTDEEKAHDGMYDISVTKLLYEKVRGGIPQIPKVEAVLSECKVYLIIKECPYCGEEHRHGSGGEEANYQAYGHRHSHCNSSQPNRGYVLIPKKGEQEHFGGDKAL